MESLRCMNCVRKVQKCLGINANDQKRVMRIIKNVCTYIHTYICLYVLVYIYNQCFLQKMIIFFCYLERYALARFGTSRKRGDINVNILL